MNKHFVPMLVIAILLLSGCNKHDFFPDPYPKLCQIKKMDNKYSAYRSYVALFEYDAKGNPLSITNFQPEFPEQDYRFRHDSKNRTTDIIYGWFVGDLTNRFSKWQRLKYDARNRVIQDSIYYGGMVGDNPIIVPDIYSFVHVLYFKYDIFDRIIQQIATYRYLGTGPLQISNTWYFYGSKGNLDSIHYGVPNTNGASIQYYPSYDKYVNIHRTNPLWQFIDKDYSLNNAIVSAAPNKYNLPTQMTGTKATQNLFFLDLGAISVLDIEYTCK